MSMLTIRHVSDGVSSPGCMIKSALGAYRQQQRQDATSPISALNNNNNKVFVPLSAPCTPVAASASNTIAASLAKSSAGVTATPSAVHEITPLPSSEKKMGSVLTMMPSAFVPPTPHTSDRCAEMAPSTPVASVLDDTHDAAVLLTSMTAIARKEIGKEGCDLSLQDYTSGISGPSPPPLPSFARSGVAKDHHEEALMNPATSSAFAPRSLLTLAPRTTPMTVEGASEDCQRTSVCGFAPSLTAVLTAAPSLSDLGPAEYPHVLPSLSSEDDGKKTSPTKESIASPCDVSEGGSTRVRAVSMEATSQKFHPFQTGNLLRMSHRSSTDEQITFNHVSPPGSPHSHAEDTENAYVVSPHAAPISPTTPCRARLADRRKRYMTERQEQGKTLMCKENDVGFDAVELAAACTREEELDTASSREDDEMTLKANVSSEDCDDTYEDSSGTTEETERKETCSFKPRRGKKRGSSITSSARRSSSSAGEATVLSPPQPARSSSEKNIDVRDSDVFSDESKEKEAAKSAPTKKTKCLKTILRRKFSWKNYPELEAFLIANREEYLRHSALNYTVQQKQYNNRLTERLLELAGEHGYVFDEEAFSFVTVRDRIRCYFKSYVQSSKKRGVIIGYAARKAGLLTEDDLEKSANTAGRIVVPTTSTDEDCMSS